MERIAFIFLVAMAFITLFSLPIVSSGISTMKDPIDYNATSADPSSNKTIQYSENETGEFYKAYPDFINYFLILMVSMFGLGSLLVAAGGLPE